MKESRPNDETISNAVASEPERSPERIGRAKLVYRVLLFQLKLIADGFRDVLLVPVSLFSGVLGLLAGGDDPERYFRDLLRFGRRTDRFINLFDQHSSQHEEELATPTSDELLTPYKEKFLDHASRSPLVKQVDEQLDER